MDLAQLVRRSWFLPRALSERLEALARGPGAACRVPRVTKRCMGLDSAGRQIAGDDPIPDSEDER